MADERATSTGQQCCATNVAGRCGAAGAVPQVTAEQMEAARLDLGYRDHCAHILIPLNECRQQTLYMPWKCQDLRHAYEKCQYEDMANEVLRRSCHNGPVSDDKDTARWRPCVHAGFGCAARYLRRVKQLRDERKI